jgi:hypothetical protein
MVGSMTPCPQCDLPMVWSDAQRRRWCCVYGDHLVVGASATVLPLGGGRNLLRLIAGGYNQYATREVS